MTDDLRVLTVRQPWAWAIIHGGKDVENRVRNLAGSYRGPVAIHAGLSYDTVGLDDKTILDAVVRTGDTSGFHVAAVIGIVDLVGVHHDNGPGPYDGHDSVCCESPWAQSGLWHLELENPRAIKPIPAKGRLGLWRPDDELRSAILDALNA